MPSGFYKYQIYALLNKNDEALDELWRCIQYDPSNLEFKRIFFFAIEKGKITALYRLVQWANSVIAVMDMLPLCF